MSILEEPPQERYPIQTYVLESNPAFCEREQFTERISKRRTGILFI